jgi:hypothetical protein
VLQMDLQQQQDKSFQGHNIQSGGVRESGAGGGSRNTRAGMCGRYGDRQSNRGFHIFMTVSGCVVNHACVHFLVAQEQTILVIGHCLVTISLIPLNHDLKFSIVPLAFSWCLSFCKHQINPSTECAITSLLFALPLPVFPFPTEYSVSMLSTLDQWHIRR